ncbi:tripartite motif-containing protein 65-like isoform X2 [Puntigrus tetrazona]|uniref:tripartite motif-containing protein 65-like isoform X2 n=1 Tax=Puntigrus tetrazona TaxID=1606681 RepID=UPI001C8A4E01|nr:tripartite motif-containing protein 65-like isoform X2 [Puntigrus tetrazona]
MAEGSISVEQDQFSCPVCLDLLKNPVTIPCGHSFCMSCITHCWNQEDWKGLYTCPQCRRTFAPRPALCKNVMFAKMVEKLNMTKLQAAVPAGHFDRREEFRSGKPHKVTGRLQQTLCPQHHKQLEMYCRTDQKYICYLCAVDEHKHHTTVAALDERTEKQKHLEQTQRDFQQRIQLREKDLQELREVVKTHQCSAQKAVEESERNFNELIIFIERSRSEVTQIIRDREKAAVSRAEERMKKLEQEIGDLKSRNTELEKLLQTDDHIHFLQSVESCSVPPQTTDVSRITASSHLLYNDVVKSVLLLKKNLEHFCKEVIDKISCTVQDIQIISTSEERIQSPQQRSRAPMSGSPTGRPQNVWSQSRSLSDSKYWHFME